jgi:hypothetical protein
MLYSAAITNNSVTLSSQPSTLVSQVDFSQVVFQQF